MHSYQKAGNLLGVLYDLLFFFEIDVLLPFLQHSFSQSFILHDVKMFVDAVDALKSSNGDWSGWTLSWLAISISIICRFGTSLIHRRELHRFL